MTHSQPDPFRGYIGQYVKLRESTAEIVDVAVRGRALCFIGRETESGRELFLPLRYLLEHLIEEV